MEWNERSDSIKELIAALVKFQNEVPLIPKTRENPFFKSRYADLSDIIQTCKPIWIKNDLSVFQDIFSRGEFLVIKTIVCHVSGEYKASHYEIPRLIDAQKTGSAVTYARRYSLQAALGISADEDDDGNSASKGAKDVRPKPSNRQVPSNTSHRNQASQSTIENHEGDDSEFARWSDEPFPEAAPAGPSQGATPGGEGALSSHPTTSPVREFSSISDKQVKMFWAVTKSKAWTNEQVRLFLKHVLKIEHSNQIKWKDFDHLIKAIQGTSDLDHAIDDAINRLKGSGALK